MKRIFIIILTVILIIPSCKKYLDKKASTGITIPETVSDLQALLDDANTMNRTRTPSYGEAFADDYFLLQEDYQSLTERDQSVYKWIPYENYDWDNDWSIAYSPIYNANYCLEQIELNQKSNQESWNNVKGSALFYRSYYFLQLAWTFCHAYEGSTANTDLGIALRTTSNLNDKFIRATLNDTYERIIKDTKESITYLKDFSSHPMRPSKVAAYGLLARIYWSMREYDSAFKYSNLCFELKSDLIDFNGDSELINPLDGIDPPFKPFNKEVLFYSEMCFDVDAVHIAYAKIDSLLYTSFETNDLRRSAYFTPNGDFQQFKGSYTDDPYVRFTGLTTDETILIRAECYARGGDKDAALSDLNTLLARRYDVSFVPLSANTADEALQLILEHRRKELVFRGLRFIDVKRLNKEGHNITLSRTIDGQVLTLPPNDNRYAAPLPLEVIKQSGMQQNPY